MVFPPIQSNFSNYYRFLKKSPILIYQNTIKASTQKKNTIKEWTWTTLFSCIGDTKVRSYQMPESCVNSIKCQLMQKHNIQRMLPCFTDLLSNLTLEKELKKRDYFTNILLCVMGYKLTHFLISLWKVNNALSFKTTRYHQRYTFTWKIRWGIQFPWYNH